MKNKDDEKTTRLCFEGELTIKRASEIRGQIIESLSKFQHVEVEIGDVANVDLSYLQLMCSAHRFAAKNGKKITLINQDGSLFSEIKLIAGFVTGKECGFDRKNNCLWMEEQQC